MLSKNMSRKKAAILSVIQLIWLDLMMEHYIQMCICIYKRIKVLIQKENHMNHCLRRNLKLTKMMETIIVGHVNHHLIKRMKTISKPLDQETHMEIICLQTMMMMVK